MNCGGSQGAIMMQEGGGSSLMRFCTLLGAGETYGWWIYNVGSSFTIEDCDFDSMRGIVLFGWSPYTVRRTAFRNITGDRIMEMRFGTTVIEDCAFQHCRVKGFLFGVIYSAQYTLARSTFCDTSTPVFQGPWSDLGGNDFNAPCSCFGDLDGDGIVGAEDLAVVLVGWQSGSGTTSGDISGDGETDGSDLGLLLVNWGACQP